MAMPTSRPRPHPYTLQDLRRRSGRSLSIDHQDTAVTMAILSGSNTTAACVTITHGFSVLVNGTRHLLSSRLHSGGCTSWRSTCMVQPRCSLCKLSCLLFRLWYYILSEDVIILQRNNSITTTSVSYLSLKTISYVVHVRSSLCF